MDFLCEFCCRHEWWHIFCLLTSMALILIPNYSLLCLHGNMVITLNNNNKFGGYEGLHRN